MTLYEKRAFRQHALPSHAIGGLLQSKSSYVSLSEHIRFSSFIFYRGQQMNRIGAISPQFPAAGPDLAKTMPTSATGMCARSFSAAQLRHQPFSRPFSLRNFSLAMSLAQALFLCSMCARTKDPFVMHRLVPHIGSEVPTKYCTVQSCNIA